jgi:two-component system response regulator FlrC
MNITGLNTALPFPIGVIGLTPKGIIFYANQIALDIFNIDLLNRQWSDILELSIQSTENGSLFKINSHFVSFNTEPMGDKNGQLIFCIEDKSLVEPLRKIENTVFNTKHEAIISNEKIKQIYQLALKVADQNISVLISGESGTGKEVLSQYIHAKSNRSNEPFVSINCAAIPENMLESLLFGYEKGAFTGAYQSTPGKFELAHTGTLLLDEVTEMPMILQAKLLRVIQEKEVERIGAKKPIKIDVRIIATTNRNLKKEVQEGRFREDLYYRLNVFPIHLPALRDRKDEIIPLANRFLSEGMTLTDEAKQKITQYNWPGNIRELQNVILRAKIFSEGQIIMPKDIVFDETNVAIKESKSEACLGEELDKKEFEIIQTALIECKDNRTEVSKKLGISTRTLRYKLAKMKEMGWL